MNQIFLHSCESMPELINDSVSLTVTSPPYWNAVDYDIHAADKNQDYRTRAYSEGYVSYSTYLDWLAMIFAEVFRVTKPGGLCAVIIGTVLFEGKHYPVPFDLTSRLTQNGWEFHQDIIWHKCTAGVKRAGKAIQHPYPGYYYPNIMTEYILIFRKPGPKIFLDHSPEKKRRAQYPINRLFTMDIANNVWHIAPIPPGYLDHPCPYPEEIPHRLISFYSYTDDLVLDPFVGSGQTTKVAHHLGRKFVGYEIIAKYAELATNRLNEPLGIRPEQLIAVFEKIPVDEPTAQTTTKDKPSQNNQSSQPSLFDSL
jgi:DNA modification methylase